MAFLSAEWIERLDEAGRGCGRPDVDAPPAVVAHRVTGVAGGERTYHLRIDATGVRVAPGAPDEADVTFTADLATAAGIARGDRHARRELTEGRLRVAGTGSALTPWQDSLAAFEEAAAPVRADTEYDVGA